MAIEKTYTQLIDQAHYDDHLGITIPIHGEKKYKKRSFRTATDELADLKLKSGSRIIAVCQKHKSPYYLLCTVLDFQDENSFWDNNTELIVQINEVSQGKYQTMVNRLRTVTMSRSYLHHNGLVFIEAGKGNWKRYIPTGNKNVKVSS